MQTIRLKREPCLLSKQCAFSYQAEAVQAIREREYAAVFHEQGLGKTKIAIDLLLYWLERRTVDTVLLVVKRGLVENWRRELAVHSFLQPRILTQDRRANFFVFNSPARVILAHYEVVKAEHSRLRLFLRTRVVGAILDEAAKIKNPDSALTKAFFDLAPLFARRVIMTGTPIANRPFDIWAPVWFLDQGTSLGKDFAGFRREVDLSNRLSGNRHAQEAFQSHLEAIHQRIAGFSVRETKASGVISLPQKVIGTVVTDWEPRQLDLYRRIRNETRAVVVRDGFPSEDDSEEVLKRLLRLVQVASNPRLVDASYTALPGKLPALLDLCADAVQKGEKAIVWTCFTENVEWLARELARYSPAMVHGKLGMGSRVRGVDRFMQDENCRILVATPGAAKEGLTLTVANHAIFFDRTFSLDDYLQAQDRIHRISQRRTCYVSSLIMDDSVDEWVDVLLRAKQLAASLANGDISPDFYKSQMTYSFGRCCEKSSVQEPSTGKDVQDV